MSLDRAVTSIAAPKPESKQEVEVSEWVDGWVREREWGGGEGLPGERRKEGRREGERGAYGLRVIESKRDRDKRRRQREGRRFGWRGGKQ